MQTLGDKGGSDSGGGSGTSAPPQKRLKGGRGDKKQALSITARGYEYMLLDIQSQVWLFVLECLKKTVSSQVDILYMIFMLSFCQAGTGYAISLLSPPQQLLLTDLCDMGLVYIPHREETRDSSSDSSSSGSSSLFYPTHISINMLYIPSPGGASTPSGGSGSGGRVLRNNAMNSMSLTIIVETNFQVVAYVSSNLHMAMLSLFVDTRSMIRLSNMVR